MNPRKPRVAPKTPISLGGVAREHLPLPYVHYPRHYGTFFAFSETRSSPVSLCECALPAITNYIELRTTLHESSSGTNNSALEHLDDRHLPSAVVDSVQARHPVQLANLRFRRAICHRCNLVPPSRRYCHEMYGVVFIQRFGWYVNQAYLRYGILPGAIAYLPEHTPQEYIADMTTIKAAQANLDQAWQWFRDRDEELLRRILQHEELASSEETDFEEIGRRQDILREAQKGLRRAQRALSTEIENSVREEFGFRKVGEQWTSETLLFQIVSNLLPDRNILRHHRPPWLGGLELDIYIPSIQLAIEYQGQQHFHAIPAWGGEDALRHLQERDNRKAELCKASRVKLLTIDYTEPLTHNYVRKRLSVQPSQST